MTEKYITENDTNHNWDAKKLEQKMTKHCDKVYKSLFQDCKIKRPETSKLKTSNMNVKDVLTYLDKHHGIDTYIVTKNVGTLTVQEKILRASKQKYNHLTWEYYNNPETANKASFKDKGEWFKGMAQLLLFGYANEEETALGRWYLIDITRFKMYIAMNYRNVESVAYVNQNPYPAKANFLCFSWDFVEQHCPECIIDKYNKNALLEQQSEVTKK